MRGAGAMYKAHCAVVTQFDRSWTWLSCREHLHLAYAFHQASLSSEELTRETETLLEKTGLTSCAGACRRRPVPASPVAPTRDHIYLAGASHRSDVRAPLPVHSACHVPPLPPNHPKSDILSGSDDPEEMADLAGLSGGQRRRLSLAIALAKKPALLVADEPTSGLDSAAAAAIMSLLGELAHDSRVAVACTIHQPSASVYAGIETLLLLTKARTAYYGPASELMGYVASLGNPVPAGVSVSEHALDLVNADFASEESVEEMIEAWRKRAPAQPVAPPVTFGALPPEPRRASFLRQCGLLYSRHLFKLLVRDPLALIVIFVLMSLDILWIGVYMFDSLRTDDQVEIVRRYVFLLCGVSAPSIYVIIICTTSAIERVRVMREVGNGMYSPMAFLLVTSSIQIPLTYFISASVVAFLYAWGDFYWGSIGWSCLIFGASIWSSSCFAQLAGWQLGVKLGPLAYILFFAGGFAANGWFAPTETILWPWRAIAYISPTRYAVGGLAYHLFRDAPNQPGARQCTPSADGSVCPRGFTCTDASTESECLGATGEQILDSLSAQYDNVFVSDIVMRHWAIIMGIGLGFKSIFAILLYLDSIRRVEPVPPAQAEPMAPLTDQPSAEAPSDVDAFTTLREASTSSAERIQLVIRNASLQLIGDQEAEGKTKFLLADVSADCEGGEVLSIMGPSGAGKTTLLNVLVSEATKGRAEEITGEITLNGHALSPALVREQCAYVEQKDIGLFPYLSCVDHVRFAVTLLRGDLSPAATTDMVAAILGQMGLASCQHTRAGSLDITGLSGGQRRRLSLAIALAKKPALLVADEPTTGLDSAAAAAIMSLLGELAIATNMAVTCTIHQPSASVYDNMGKLLLLTKARTAYYGPASELMGYVASLGNPVPAGVSVSEHALDLVNADFASEESVEEMIEAWRKRAPPPLTAEIRPLPAARERASGVRLCLTLIEKIFKNEFYDPGTRHCLVCLVCLECKFINAGASPARRTSDGATERSSLALEQLSLSPLSASLSSHMLFLAW